MRKVVASEHVSLDGVMEAPEWWSFAYFNEEMGQEIGAAMATSDAMLMERTNYEEWAAYWPNQDSEENRIAGYMNSVPKFVVSTTLEGPLEWNNSTMIEDDLPEEMGKLKRLEGGDISISGSRTVIRSPLAAGLLDELRLMVHPLVLGGGKLLFGEGGDRRELVDSKTFATGAVSLHYRLATGPASSDLYPQEKLSWKR